MSRRRLASSSEAERALSRRAMVRRAFSISSRMLICGLDSVALSGDSATWFLMTASLVLGSLLMLERGSLLLLLMLVPTATWSSSPEQAPRTRFGAGDCTSRTDPGRFGVLAAAGLAIKVGFRRTREEQECRSAAAAALRRGSRAGGSTVVPAMVAAAESREQRSNDDHVSTDLAAGGRK
uniref:Uncharacterized protein n=1 Tax=Triticum urartu TaxID=4572 RepID=A0A8R7R554_TRIUA